MKALVIIVLAIFPAVQVLQVPQSLEQHDYVVTEDEVTFYLYTRGITELKITSDNIRDINKGKPFKFVVHGWVASHKTAWLEDAASAYLIKGDYNVVLVDWEAPASQEFDVAASNTKGVGYFVGKFISGLVQNYSVQLDNISIDGHSFGAHVAGFAGKNVEQTTGSKVYQITAIDPARNDFENDSISTDDRLYKTDARIVSVIHTDAGYQGFLEPVGTTDFYPNGGVDPQPPCEEQMDEGHSCSHNIVTAYFVESIQNDHGFLSTKCESYEAFVTGTCESNEKVPIGGPLANAEGVYYLYTNSEKPYSKE